MGIELLAGTMRLGRGGIVAVEDGMRQTYTVKHIRKGLLSLSEANPKGRKGPRESVVQFEPQMNERWDFR